VTERSFWSDYDQILRSREELDQLKRAALSTGFEKRLDACNVLQINGHGFFALPDAHIARESSRFA
jgi:hypothetical protein